MVFLQCDRYVEIHSGPGRYYRLRIPKFGHDMKYHYPSCDVFLVGSRYTIIIFFPFIFKYLTLSNLISVFPLARRSID